MGASLFVEKFYQMDPAFEDLLFEGTELKDGMIVLLEDFMMRADLSMADQSKYEESKALEVNRWAVVSHVKIRQRFEHNEHGDVIGEGSPLVSFIATYGDGTKTKRSYDSSYAWIVKLESIPKE